MTQIYEFDPVIYPFRLWVAVNPSPDEIKEKFYGFTTDNERVEIQDDLNDCFKIATTTIVSDKKSGWVGCFVSIWKPKQMDVKTIAHEASHVADFISEQFGITMDSFENGEAKAYLVGWAADCIEKVKKGRF